MSEVVLVNRPLDANLISNIRALLAATLGVACAHPWTSAEGPRPPRPHPVEAMADSAPHGSTTTGALSRHPAEGVLNELNEKRAHPPRAHALRLPPPPHSPPPGHPDAWASSDPPRAGALRDPRSAAPDPPGSAASSAATALRRTK